MKTYGHLVDAILELLAVSPEGMTSVALASAIGDVSTNTIYAVADRMLRPTSKHPQRIHIALWVDDELGVKKYPRPVYRLGAGRNRKRPEPKTKMYKQQYVERKRNRLRTNSVFNLGTWPRVT